MTFPSANRAPRSRFLVGAQLGAGAFACGALLDVIFARHAVGGWALALLVVGLFGLMATLGAVVGALGASVWPMVNRLWGPAMLAVPTGAALGFKLCSGAWVSRIVPPWAGAAILGVIAVPAGLFAAWLVRRVGVGVKTAPLWVMAGVALYLCDAFVYRPLYPAAHLALFLAYIMAFALALAAVRPMRRGTALVATALVLLSAGLGAWALARAPGVRFAALERTNAARKVLALLPAFPPAEENPLFTRRARAARPPAARSSSATPGAVPGDELPAGLKGAHIVLVTIDALRADRLGLVRGGASLTPRLDQLAAASVRFKRAYVQAPHSSFSLASLHTSEYVHSTVELHDRLPTTLAETLAARGYQTSAYYTSGVFFTEREKVRRFAQSNFGFKDAVSPPIDAPELTDAVIDRLARLREEGEPPLFLWAHYFDVHEPYVPRPEFDYGTGAIDHYDSEVSFTDRAVGRLIAALAHLKRPTVLCVTSDHGEEFREHGGVYHGSSLYEEQVRVPLLIAAPGLRPGVVEGPVEMIDVAPTLLSLVGVEPPSSMRGRDLMDLIEGRSAPRPVFSEVDTKKMVVRGRHKLIHDFRLATWELYDLESDPRERVNLYDREPAIAEELRQELGRWFDRIERSVAAEGVPRPPGIDLGRLGDRRAVPMLTRLLDDVGATIDYRAEAAHLLGRLRDRDALPGLWKALDGAPEGVREEIAIAIGELDDQRGREPLGEVIRHPDPMVRGRAAIALAKLGDSRASSALIEGLGHPEFQVRKRVVHYLGMVAGSEAVEPLLELSGDPRLRYLVTLSLGRIGKRAPDPRILPFLLERLEGDVFADVRGYAAVALGFMGDQRPIPTLVRMLHEQPEVKWTSETLVRLGALGKEVPGVDFRPKLSGRGIGPCHQSGSLSVDNYMGATWCELRGSGARVWVSVPEPRDYTVLLRVRSLSPGLAEQPLTLVVNGEPLDPVPLATVWEEHRIPTGAARWKRGRNELVFRFPTSEPAGEGLVGVDHVLLSSGQAFPRRGP